MDKKKRRKKKIEQEQNERDEKDSSMESIAPLGNLSSAGNNDDGQSITNLYEQQKNDLMPEASDQKKQKSRNHSPKDRHQDQKISTMSPDNSIDIANARRGSH